MIPFDSLTFGNRTYRDSVFRMLFKEPENLLSLYNALHGTHYSDPSQVRVYTIESALFMSYKNDVAFILDNFLNLYEHQSTFNPNMPLRGLFYFARSYERYIREHNYSRYGSRLIMLPAPEYIIFYNGPAGIKPRMDCRLSDAFIKSPKPSPKNFFSPEDGTGQTEADAGHGNIGYEWTATYIDINAEENRTLVEACRPLLEYSYFVTAVKKNISEKKCTLAEALKDAIIYCRSRGILTDFLWDNEEAVMDWFLEYYDEEEERRLLSEEWKEAGLEEGRAEGRAEGLFKAVSILLEKQHVSVEEACNLLNVSADDYRKYVNQKETGI